MWDISCGIYRITRQRETIIIPSLSDKQRKRQRYLYLGFALSIPGLIGVTYANSSWLLMVSAFWLGFFLVSTFPVGMQYAAEITHPTPEGTSTTFCQVPLPVCGGTSLLGPDGLLSSFTVDTLIIRFQGGLSSELALKKTGSSSAARTG